jgi:hypothetical protein
MNGDLLRTLPDHVLITKVFTYFGFKDYALTGCASHYAQAHWQSANRRKPLPLYHTYMTCTAVRAARLQYVRGSGEKSGTGFKNYDHCVGGRGARCKSGGQVQVEDRRLRNL